MNDNNCEMLSEIIYRKVNLIELYISWNNISSNGGELLFNHMQDN